VERDELVDTHNRIAAKLGGLDNTANPGSEFLTHFATNRPEDLEVDEDGAVFIALTNNSNVKDSHGSIRRLREAGNDATALSFEWEDYAPGGPRNRSEPGEQGFSSPDNLVFDKGGNLWVVTDISSSALNRPTGPYAYHANNAIFMVPRTGPNAGVAYRFANMPVQAEGTGPYFTPDERTLFVNVQHPGEESGPADSNAADQSPVITSYWPRGNKTIDQNPSEPIPSMVAITKVAPAASQGAAGSAVIPIPPAGLLPDGTRVPAKDARRPGVSILSSARLDLGRLRGASGLTIRLRVDEPVKLRVTVGGRLTGLRPGGRRGAVFTRLARVSLDVAKAGEVSVRLKPNAALRLRLKREKAVPALLSIRAEDRSGNVQTRTKQLRLK
jgi:hypothetical protein